MEENLEMDHITGYMRSMELGMMRNTKRLLDGENHSLEKRILKMPHLSEFLEMTDYMSYQSYI